MNFVRTIINSDKLNNIIQIPEDLKHQNVELLILPIKEEKVKGKKSFNPDDFIGILHKDEKELEKDLDSIRNEWDRF